MDEQSGMSVGKGETIILFIQEMLIDVFGILIPGFCFIVMTAMALGVPLLDLDAEISSLKHFAEFREFFAKNATVIFISTLLFSFVVGHLLYRQDPRWPDTRSITRRWKTISKSGCVRTREGGDEEYPYGHLKEYFEDRGFDELAAFVNWSGADFGAKPTDEQVIRARKRSKHFINTHKLDIKHRNSRLYFDILRNEAHIRLMSSIWYGALALIVISALGLALGAIVNVIPACKTGVWRMVHFDALLSPTLTFACAIATIYSIEMFFHYQRVREIVYVLQAWKLTTPASSAAASE